MGVAAQAPQGVVLGLWRRHIHWQDLTLEEGQMFLVLLASGGY